MLQGKFIPDPDSLLPHFHQRQSKTHLIVSIFPLCRDIINIVNSMRLAAWRGMSREMHYDQIFHWYTIIQAFLNPLMVKRYQEAYLKPMKKAEDYQV